MDPESTLQELREHVRAAQNGETVDVDRALDLVEALDQWLCGGGFLPREWANPATGGE
jgi:hypothetical protein